MRPADLARLVALSAVWGGSFIFMRIAAPALGAVTTAGLRVAIAGLALVVYAVLTRHSVPVRERWKQFLVIGALNSAIPFSLFCWAEIRISASLASILNATSPIFGAVCAAIWLGDSLTWKKLTGLAISLAGVVLLMGWTPGATDNLAAAGACLLASLCYGLGATYTKRAPKAEPASTATGSQVAAALLLAPLVPFNLPASPPSGSVWAAVVTLAVVCTAAAYLVYFRLIADVGPTKALTVTYLTPIFGVLWGALFLAEPIGLAKIASMAVILAGTALVNLSGGHAGKQLARRAA